MNYDFTVPSCRQVRYIVHTDCKNEADDQYTLAHILMTPKTETVEDYRDVVTAIKFSVGGFFGGYTDITIRKNDKGAVVKVQKTLAYDELLDDRQISPTKWQKIVNTLYSQLYLHEWKKSFVDPCVLDGTQWSLEISLMISPICSVAFGCTVAFRIPSAAASIKYSLI